MKLICLPYAGGSENTYYNWRSIIRPSIEVLPIELKGRGKRYNEEFYKDIMEAVDDIYNIIENKIKDSDYAIFGHSMGSILAYELYYKIEEKNQKKPMHIFFSAHAAPETKENKEILHTLSDSEFAKSILQMGGTCEEVFQNEELLNFFLPIIRNDIKLLETYTYKEKRNKINCDISVINGEEDDISLDELLAWEKHTCKNYKLHMVNGDHFFINNNINSVIQIINNTL